MKSRHNFWGLDALDHENELAKKDSEVQYIKIKKLYQSVFAKEGGKAVLDHLKKITTEQPTWLPSANNDAIHTAFVREGQNSIVRYIESLLSDD